MKQDADGHLSMADEIAAGAADAFLKESSMKLSASLALEEFVIHELLPEARLNDAPSNSSFIYRGKNAKQLKKIIKALKENAEASANESLQTFKDYSKQGITLAEQEQYLQSCTDKSDLTKCSDSNHLYDAPCLRKATHEQKNVLTDFCEELDRIIGGKCHRIIFIYSCIFFFFFAILIIIFFFVFFR